MSETDKIAQNVNAGLTSDPDCDVVQDLFLGFAQFLVLENALKTDLLDHIEQEPSPVSVATLSRKHGYHSDILERLLDNFASMKLVQKSKDDGTWKYSNTGTSSVYLTKGSAYYLGDTLQADKMLVEKTSSGLIHTLKAGPRNQLKKFIEGGNMNNINANIKNKENVDDNMNVNREVPKSKNEDQVKGKTETNSNIQNMNMNTGAMNSFSSPTDAKVKIIMRSMDSMMYSCRHVLPNIFDLSGHRKAVDLGGGTGYLARLLTDFYPQLRTTVFEMPHIANMYRSAHEQRGGSDRVTFLAGDFFQDDLPTADLYILSRVLHNWNETSIHKLLAKIYISLPAGGKLLVLEKFLNERKEGPGYATNLNLNMSSICDGKERTASEYQQLVEKEGFADTRYSVISGTNFFDALITCKPF